MHKNVCEIINHDLEVCCFVANFSQVQFCKITRETAPFFKTKKPKKLEVKIPLDTSKYSKNARRSTLAF